MIEIPATSTAKKPWVDMTPMVDVIFTIIIFMMLVINAPSLSQKIDLPISEQTQRSPSTQDAITLNVLAEGKLWAINDHSPITKEVVLKELKDMQSDNQITVFIAVDKSASAQKFIETLDLLKEAKITKTEVLIDRAADK